MFRPDYDFQKKRKSSLIVPTIFLGLVFGVILGVLFDFLPGRRYFDRLSWTPALAHAPAETSIGTPVSTVVIVEKAAVTPASTTAVLSLNDPISVSAFVLPDLFDESLNHSLGSYNGRPVILNFWASWCVPCKEEMPALQRAYEKYRDAGLIVLGVNQTFVDDLETARGFVNELSLTFPNVRDDTGNTSEGLYQVMGLPTSVFITPDGQIVHKQIGQMTDEQIESFSRQLIAGEAIKP
jgi:thiol-disulfide isomerase/thioredoxin